MSDFDIYRNKVWDYLKIEYCDTMDLFYASLNMPTKNLVVQVEILNNIYLNGIENLIEEHYSNGNTIPMAAYGVVTIIYEFLRHKGVKIHG